MLKVSSYLYNIRVYFFKVYLRKEERIAIQIFNDQIKKKQNTKLDLDFIQNKLKVRNLNPVHFFRFNLTMYPSLYCITLLSTILNKDIMEISEKDIVFLQKTLISPLHKENLEGVLFNSQTKIKA